MSANKELVTIPASYEILTDLDKQSVPIGIEYCGRVCYKSEDKITDKSAPGFCRHMATSRHNSVLEMRVVSFTVTTYINKLKELKLLMPKFLFIDVIDDDNSSNVCTILVTGSVRAFREMAMLYPHCAITSKIARSIESRYPCLFADITSKFRQIADAHLDLVVLRYYLAQIDNIEDHNVFLRHRHIAVKFIVNRAVTHEIVRHRPCSFLQESQRYCRYADDKFGNRVTFIEPMFFEKGSQEYQIWEASMLFEEKQYFRLLETSTPQASRTVLPNSCKTEIIVFANLVEWNHILHMRTSTAAEPSMREVMVPLQKDFCELFPGFDFNRRFPENFLTN
jgi:thymidylate synthase (FAD)